MNNIEINSLSKEDLINKVKGLPSSLKKFLNHILRYANYYTNLWWNQTTMGSWNGVVRQTANRYVRILVELGILFKKYRHMNTCEYYLNPHFRDPEVREKLSGYFRVFVHISMIYLFAFWRIDCIVDVTQNIIVNRFINKPINSLSNRYRLTDSREAAKQKALRVYMTAVHKEYIREIGHLLNLTDNGRLQFVIFPEEALLYALEVLRKAHRNNQLAAKFNVFNFALSLCHDWCRDNQKVKAVGLVDELAREYKIDRNSPFIKPRSHASGKYEQSFHQPAFNRIPRKEIVPQWKQKGESKRLHPVWDSSKVRRMGQPITDAPKSRPMHEIRLTKAIANGDEAFVKRLKSLEPDWNDPVTFKKGYEFAKKVPDFIKQKGLEDYEENPEMFTLPVIKVIEEYSAQIEGPLHKQQELVYELEVLPEIDLPDILGEEPDIDEEIDVGPYRFEDIESLV